MNFPWTTLIELRRREEGAAERTLGGTIEVRVRCERLQHDLDERARLAAQRVDSSRQELSPLTADEAAGRERWRARLRIHAQRAAADAAHHRQGALRDAHAAEEAARAGHLKARQEREAVELLRDRAEQQQRTVQARRADDAALDQANAARARR